MAFESSAARLALRSTLSAPIRRPRQEARFSGEAMKETISHLVNVALIIMIAALGAAMKYDFPPGESWPKFVGALIFFAGSLSPILLVSKSHGAGRARDGV
jgi:hypothetical protein